MQRPRKFLLPEFVKSSHFAADIVVAFQKAFELFTYCAQQHSPKLLPAQAEIEISIAAKSKNLIIYISFLQFGHDYARLVIRRDVFFSAT